MAITLAASLRSSRMTAWITDAGASAKLVFKNGATVLATLTFGANIGTVSAGVLTFGSFTQSNGSHVSGTPTSVELQTSVGTVIATFGIGSGSDNIAFSGTIATGQNVTGTLTVTDGNA